MREIYDIMDMIDEVEDNDDATSNDLRNVLRRINRLAQEVEKTLVHNRNSIAR